MFYLHALSLPMFYFLRDDLVSQATALHASPTTQLVIPSPLQLQSVKSLALDMGLGPRNTSHWSQQHVAALSLPSGYIPLVLNTLTQMAWAAILSVLTDRRDVVFGVTVSGRPGELAGVETMVGLFINTVPLRVRLDPLRRVGEQCLALQRDAAELREHSYLSHTELRSLGGVGELFDSLLVYENFPPGGLVGSGEFDVRGATFRPRALQSLAERHPVLRSGFRLGADGRLLQVVHKQVGLRARVTDISELAQEEQRRRVQAWVAQEKHDRFTWSQAPLLRVFVHLCLHGSPRPT